MAAAAVAAIYSGGSKEEFVCLNTHVGSQGTASIAR